MKRCPLVAVTLPLIGGIVLADVLKIPIPYLPFLIVLILAAIIGMVCGLRRKNDRLFQLAAILTFALAGYALVVVHDPILRSSHYSYHIGSGAPMRVTLTEPSQPTAHGQKAVAEVYQVGSTHTTGRIILFFRNGSPLGYGEHLSVKGTLSVPSGSENPYQFDYRRYLRHKKVCYQMFVDSADVTVLDEHEKGLTAWSQRIRLKLVHIVQSLDLTPGEQGIAEALLLGWKSDLSPETQQQFRNAGITHLLCVSGLHVGIIAVLIGWLLFWIRKGPKGRWMTGLLQLAGVWGFAFITGLAPATTRAALMFSIFIIGKMTLNESTPYNSLAASALVLLLINPGILYDVGFQLSYTAVLGITSLYRPLYHIFPWPEEVELNLRYEDASVGRRIRDLLPLRTAQKIWATFCVTTSAQLATLPLTLYYFHQFPTYFLIANMLVVPFAGLLLGTIIAAVLFSRSALLCSLLHWELSATDSLTRLVAGLPHAVIDRIPMDEVMVVLAVLILILFALWLHKRRPWLIPATLGMVFVLVLYCRQTILQHNSQQMVIYYQGTRHTAVEVVEGRESTLIADEAVAQDPTIIGYQCENLLLRRQITRTRIISTDTVTHIRFAGEDIYL